MKVCFPVEKESGLDSTVCEHFGQAPVFLVVDTGSGETRAIRNESAGHAHGQCAPVAMLAGKGIDCLVVGGIGAGAIMKLQASGIEVYVAASPSVKKNLELLEQGGLQKVDIRGACQGHGHDHEHGGGCAHNN